MKNITVQIKLTEKEMGYINNVIEKSGVSLDRERLFTECFGLAINDFICSESIKSASRRDVSETQDVDINMLETYYLLLEPMAVRIYGKPSMFGTNRNNMSMLVKDMILGYVAKVVDKSIKNIKN